MPSLRVNLALLMVNLFVIALATISLTESYAYHHNLALAASQNLSTVLAETIDGIIGRVDVAMFSIVDGAGKLSNPNPDSAHEINDLLRREQQRLPMLASLRVTNAQGQTLYASDSDPKVPPLDVSDRDYFTALRDAPEPQLYISKPILGRLTQKWMVVFARRIETQDGTFFGIVYAPMPIERFTQLFAPLALGRDGAVALRYSDLSVVARFPDKVGEATSIGTTAVSPELEKMVGVSPRGGSYEAKAKIDGIQRVLTYRHIEDTPLYVVVGLATESYLDEWWRDAIVTGGLVLMFFLATLVGSIVLSNIWRSRMEAHRRLQASTADLEQFTEVLAHHLQEPVRLQHLFAQYLKLLLPQPFNADIRQALDNITTGAIRLRALLKDVQSYLAVSQDEASNSACDADKALDEVLNQLADKIKETKATIERSNLPSPIILKASLAQVFYSLIDNAMEYRHPDRPLMIRVSGGKSDEHAVFTVTDNGIGIAPEHRERVFKVFERLHPEISKTGTGIGLPLSRKIIESAHGHIRVEDGEDGGTKMVIVLPL